MSKKLMGNKDLENFISKGSRAVGGEGHVWEKLDPNAKRTGVAAYNVALNHYEKAIIDAAATKEGAKSSGFIRQTALKRAKTILGID